MGECKYTLLLAEDGIFEATKHRESKRAPLSRSSSLGRGVGRGVSGSRSGMGGGGG